jgi:hypothetical protein
LTMSRPQRKLPEPPPVHGSGQYKKTRRQSNSSSAGDTASSAKTYKKNNFGRFDQLRAVLTLPDPRSESPGKISRYLFLKTK